MPARAELPVKVGFRASIIALFVGIVLFVGLTLVYLSFSRVASITRTAASTFIEKVAQLGADRIDSQFKSVRDCLDILSGLPSIQSAEIDDNPRLIAILGSMLRNNPQLFSLYAGYEDGSFIEIDAIDRAGPKFRPTLNAPEDAVYRLVVITKTGKGAPGSTVSFLSDNLIPISDVPGPSNYNPRERPWYVDAFKFKDSLLTGPYIFFATGQPGYTLRIPLEEGRRGVIAGDILLDKTESMLSKQGLGQSGLAFLFDDQNRILAHPQMAEIIASQPDRRALDLPKIEAIKLPGLAAVIRSWNEGGRAQQFFSDQADRAYVAAFHKLQTTGPTDIRLAVLAPLDEFYSEIIAERRWLFAVALGFVAATLPLVFWLGSMMARSLRGLARETDKIQRFELTEGPQVHSIVKEIDDLGHSVFTMRSVVRTFSNFVPKRLVQQLIESGIALQLGGARREVTLLFTDVADFTAITEKADPSEVMVHTSRYFAVMSEAIMANKGTVDKFIGDAVMAIWNAPVDDPDHIVNACAAALACLRNNGELNKVFESEGWPAYRTRFGLHAGDAVVGNIGSSDRMNYTALGATVNLAARLEGLNKNYGTSILVSEAVKARADSGFIFRAVDRIKPKGFAEDFTIYELRSARGPNSGAAEAFCREWNEIYASLQDAEATLPLASLTAFIGKYPNDGVARYHATRLGQAANARPLQVVP
nr:adenylate/guanylate cyclase domain-containing protein [Bradyrhizobium sp.]